MDFDDSMAFINTLEPFSPWRTNPFHFGEPKRVTRHPYSYKCRIAGIGTVCAWTSIFSVEF